LLLSAGLTFCYLPSACFGVNQ